MHRKQEEERKMTQTKTQCERTVNKPFRYQRRRMELPNDRFWIRNLFHDVLIDFMFL